jgi:hypothetical protein
MQTGRIIAISLLCALGAVAQDKITVPLSNPSQPVTIKATLTNARITVVAGSGRDVIITGNGASERERPRATPPPGMKEIGGSSLGIDVEEDHNVVTISRDRGSVGALTIETPVNTSLQIRTTNGHSIDVTGVNGDQEIANTNGSIVLTNVSGSVVAHTVNGGVTVSFDRITGDKPMSFATLNGKLDVTLPADAKARLRMRTDHGSIFSDFDVKLEADSGKPAVEASGNGNAKYQISPDKTVLGSINGGGPEFSFKTTNGDILIHKK